jgi:hypothetical protein
MQQIIVKRFTCDASLKAAKMRKRSHFGVLAYLIATAIAVALPALAYDYPLSPKAIRDAYMLGKADSSKRSEFFEKYTQHPPMPATRPHVALIQLETPFAVVVEHTVQALNYYAPDAAEEFTGKPAVFRMRVQIDLTDSYGALIPSNHGARLRLADFWKEFTIRLIQGKEIRAQKIHGAPNYFYGTSGGDLTGAEVDLEYDAAKIKPENGIVDVATPDGQDVKATFDLGNLR